MDFLLIFAGRFGICFRPWQHKFPDWWKKETSSFLVPILDKNSNALIFKRIRDFYTKNPVLYRC